MRRTRCRAGLLRRLATALRAASAAVALACAAPALAQDARLWLVAGDVVVVRPGPAGDATRRPITGDAVSAGDRIETGSDGRVQMRFSDGSVVSLQPGSRFTIDAYRFEGDAQRAVYLLTRGTLRTVTGAIGKRRHEDYKLITPTATVGVRGTEFVVEETACDPQCRPGRSAGTRVMVSQGRVAVTTRGGTVEVDAGRTVHAPSADRPAAPTTERPVLSSTMPGSSGTVADAIARAGRVDADAGASAGARFAVLSAQAATLATAGAPAATGTLAGGTRRATSAGRAPAEAPTLAKDDDGRTDGSDAPARSAGAGRVDDEPSGVTALPVGTGTGPTAAAIAPSAQRDADGAPTLATLALAGGAGPQDSSGVATGGAAGTGAGSTAGTAAPARTGGSAGPSGTGSPAPTASSGPTGTGNSGTSGSSGNSGASGSSGSSVASGSSASSGSSGSSASSGSSGSSAGFPTSPSLPVPSQTGPIALDASLLYVHLRQAPVIDTAVLATSSARVALDGAKLVSVGLCPGVLCLSRGKAGTADVGGDGIAVWGRWIDGTARLAVLGRESAHVQRSGDGMHYLVGIPTLTMPTEGSARYSLAGATSPTFSDGSSAPGSFNADAVVRFGAGRDTRIGLEAAVRFADDTRYRFATTGGLADPAASNLTMTAPNAFRGNLAVQADAPGALGCAPSGGCRAAVSGAFLGPEAARMGLGYTISGPGGGPAVNGVGVLRRNP